MGNQPSRKLDDAEVPKKVAKWRAELEHVKELNRMLSEERRIITTSMEQELYDKQVELFYLGKSATKHIGFRGYLKIINKVSPRTQADFMTPGDYNKDKKPATQSTAMVLRSAILNFSLFALFEAWLLKRMHFVSIQKHQRRLHQKGWKNIVAFYSEEIPQIQEIFAKQEPALRERVEIGKKENMDLLEEYETKLFQQEEEIMRLRKILEEMQLGDPSRDYDDTGIIVKDGKSKPRMSLDQAFMGTTEAHREFNKARSPVQALIRSMEKTNSDRNMVSSPPFRSKKDLPEKGWRTDKARTWGSSDDSEDESLYTEDKNVEEEDDEVFMVNGDKFASSQKSQPERRSREPEISVVDANDDAVSAITMPIPGISADSVSTGDSFDEPLLKKDDYSTGSGGANSLTASQRQKQQAIRDREAIRLERERLEKAKAERKRRKEMERMERESFYKQERERLQHQEKRLTMKREESTRLRHERFHDVNVDGQYDEDGEYLDAVEEINDADGNPNTKSSAADEYGDSEDEGLQVRTKSKRSVGSYVDEKDSTEEYEDEEEDEEMMPLYDLADGGKKRNPLFSPEHHPSMDTDAALFIDEDSSKRPNLDRRKLWQKDKADSDREMSVGDDDSIDNELKRLEEFETVIRSSSAHSLVEDAEDEARARSARGRGIGDDVDSSARSKSSTKKPSRKLGDHFGQSSERDEDGEESVYSKGSRASLGMKKKKKKTRRKLKGSSSVGGGSVYDDDEEELVVKKKKKKKKKKVNGDDQSYYEDEDMTVTSALTINS